jgi:hypothetical protein
MSAVMFHEGSPCMSDTNDLIHRRCILIKIDVGNNLCVATNSKKYICALNKAVNSLVTNPPVPGCGLKHPK